MAEGLPVSEFYPAWFASLVIRFEEFGGGEVQKSVAAKSPPQTRTGKGSAPLSPKKDNSIPGVSRFVLLPDNVPPGSPLDRITSGDGLTHAINGIVPREFQWAQPSLREADKLTLALRYIDFPFDPRAIRSVGVRFYLGTIRPDKWADGVTTPDADMPNVLTETWVDDRGRERSNLRFEGWADTWEIDWDAEAEPVARLEFTGHASLLIDQEAPPGLMIAADKPIDEAVALYLSNFSQFAGLTVEYRPSTATRPTLKTSLSKVAIRSEIGPPPTKAGGASSGGSGKLSVLDYLTDRLGTIGHIVTLDRHRIIIAQPRTLFSNDTGAGVTRSDDPFDGRSLGGFDYKFRGFIYGHNVEKLKMKRNYRSKRKPSNIEVRSYDVKSGQTLVVRIPENKEERTALGLPGDASSEQNWKVVYVTGINDKNTLKLVGRAHYESIGRNELLVTVHTKDLASFGGGNSDPDILDMRVGDTFSFLVKRSPDSNNALTRIENSMLLQSRAMGYLKTLGYADALSAAYAKAYVAAGFQTEFKCRSVSVSGSTTDGVAIDLTGVNYIEVRADKGVQENSGGQTETGATGAKRTTGA